MPRARPLKRFSKRGIFHTPLEFHIEEIDVEEGCAVEGKSIKESQIRTTSGAMVLAVEGSEGRMTVNPAPNVMINAGDRLILVGTREQVRSAQDLLQPVG